MRIQRIEVFAYDIPMKPFIISLGTLVEAKNILVRIFTDNGLQGWGEGSPFPMIVGETQETGLALSRDFSKLLLGCDASDIAGCMRRIHAFVPNNPTVKSAFDMALYDLNARYADMPLYRFLGGTKKKLVTDHTVSIGEPAEMADAARSLQQKGVPVIKLKVGKGRPEDDVARVKAVREAVGKHLPLRLDANQGWEVENAVEILSALAEDTIQFCEQPVAHHDYDGMKTVGHRVSIPVMADESCFYAWQARFIVRHGTCPMINIKLAKSGGLLEAIEIARIAGEGHLDCMLGGMIESRLALTANAHFACASDAIGYYDLDYCFNHEIDPVTDGAQVLNACEIVLPDGPGIGAGVDEKFLAGCRMESFEA